uniref:Antitoxin SocA-like Panacea domain-containing protein n=1 Tax=mine drainage metagenome TaxID=410659 RepID=E6QVA4_9ZZZZ
MNFKMSSLFDERKAAQVAAYFLIRASKTGANVTLLKLMKLMYLSERLSYERFGFPIIGDSLVSMPHGPVLSRTLDLMNFGSLKDDSAWDSLIAEKAGRDVALNNHDNLTVDDLRELSESDIEVLDSIWEKFGKMSAIALREYTHDSENCPEWQDPDGSSIPIQLETLFQKLGYAPQDIEKHLSNIRKQAWINSKLSA